MICEKCNVNEATIHLTEIIKDVKSEIHLCEACAREIGFNSKLSNFTISISEMLSFLDNKETIEPAESAFCKNCGLPLFEFRRSGRLGCSECYTHFRDFLMPILLSIHGEKKHIGKIPSRISRDIAEKHGITPAGNARNSTMHELKNELEQAVCEERYEDAVTLRNRMKEMTGG